MRVCASKPTSPAPAQLTGRGITPPETPMSDLITLVIRIALALNLCILIPLIVALLRDEWLNR